jgi:uncharacterized coiled-coil DUF342 family protein
MSNRSVEIADVIGEYKEMIKDLSAELVEARAYAKTLEKELLNFYTAMKEVEKDGKEVTSNQTE